MEVREEVMWFAEKMERILRRNDGKGGWKGMKHWEIHERITQELEEVTQCLAGASDSYLPDELVDVANYCMFMAWNLVRPWSDPLYSVDRWTNLEVTDSPEG